MAGVDRIVSVGGGEGGVGNTRLSLAVTLHRYQRAAERHPVDCEATLVAPGGVHSVRVRDVSLGGALLGLERPPAPGWCWS